MNNTALAAVNLNLFVVFEALMAEQHVGRAARRLGLSQPAVSHALAQLRVQLGDPLFVRTASGMLPTDKARALAVPVREALVRLGEALAPASFDPATARQSFVLAATDFVEYVLLPKLLARMSVEAPHLRLQLRSWPVHAVPPGLETGEIDLAAGFFSPKAGAALHLAPLFKDNFVCVVRQGHPRVGKRLTLRTYLELQHVLVTTDPTARGVVDVELAKRRLERTVALRLSHFLMVPPVLAATDLAAALSHRVAEPFARFLPLKIFPMPLPVPGGTVHLAWHERTSRSAAHTWLRNLMREVGGEV